VAEFSGSLVPACVLVRVFLVVGGSYSSARRLCAGVHAGIGRRGRLRWVRASSTNRMSDAGVPPTRRSWTKASLASQVWGDARATKSPAVVDTTSHAPIAARGLEASHTLAAQLSGGSAPGCGGGRLGNAMAAEDGQSLVRPLPPLQEGRGRGHARPQIRDLVCSACRRGFRGFMAP
jgi:hypothetical protein